MLLTALPPLVCICAHLDFQLFRSKCYTYHAIVSTHRIFSLTCKSHPALPNTLNRISCLDKKSPKWRTNHILLCTSSTQKRRRNKNQQKKRATVKQRHCYFSVSEYVFQSPMCSCVFSITSMTSLINTFLT